MCRVDHRNQGREGELLARIIGLVFFLTLAWFVYRVGSILDASTAEMRADPPNLTYHPQDVTQ